MTTGYFVSDKDFRLLATVSEVMLESSEPDIRELGQMITAVTLRTATRPLDVDEDELDSHWEKVCEQYDHDLLANQPAMEGWDAVWAEAEKRLRGES